VQANARYTNRGTVGNVTPPPTDGPVSIHRSLPVLLTAATHDDA
jgi:hypothetical protein